VPASCVTAFFRALGAISPDARPTTANRAIERAVALDERTGQILWTREWPADYTGMQLVYAIGPRATPTVDGELVFAISQYGDLICVEAATGKEYWRKNLGKDFGGRMMSDWGYSESPLVDGDKLVCTPGGSKGSILALNKKTGETIWQSKDFTDPAAYASLLSSDLGGKHQYIQLTGASVAGVAAENGQAKVADLGIAKSYGDVESHTRVGAGRRHAADRRRCRLLGDGVPRA
jgi:outer membrane protein assembly factor BamB